MTFDPASAIQDQLVFGEFGGVNPSVTDSSTYTFLSPNTMEEVFENEIEGCFLYSRHWNPINKYLSTALADMEDAESAQVTASGMSSIGCTILQLCKNGDEIISSPTIYGGTYALFKNFLPRLGINVRFIDLADQRALTDAVNPKTRLLYTESISNPLLEVANLPHLSQFAHANGLKLVVDNTFSPMILTPARHGADIVVYSLTKFANGTSDCVAGAICASKEFVEQLTNVNDGATMLLGPVLDSMRAASILKNLHTLHIRMQRHSKNAQAVAEAMAEWGCKVHYPGLPHHPQHALLQQLQNPGYGYGGMLALDVDDFDRARALMDVMQTNQVGYLAVSLGYFKTLFSSPGHSTSSEIPPEQQRAMGLSEGLIRFSVGLDEDIGRTIQRIKQSLQQCGILS